jgi:putative DNA primase/helicase
VGSAKRRGKVEIYSFGQYATLTGDCISEVKEAAPRQGQLADLYRTVFGGEEDEPPKKEQTEDDPKLARVRAISDEDLIVRASNAANGGKFLKLWGGEDIGDNSQADASLCAILSYWTRADAERIDRLFRQSRLFRKKWDERRGSETYGQRTVAFACRAATAFFDPDLDRITALQHNDIANTEIMVQLHGTEFIWCGNW